MPATLSIITNLFDDTERPKAIATWAAVAGMGMVLGPIAAARFSKRSAGTPYSCSTCRWPWWASSQETHSTPHPAWTRGDAVSVRETFSLVISVEPPKYEEDQSPFQSRE